MNLADRVELSLIPGEKKELEEKLRNLAEKLASENELVNFVGEAEEELDVTPALVARGAGGRIAYSFYPAGKEEEPFIKNLQRISGVRDLSEKFAERVDKIANPVTIRIFVTEFCPICPKVVDKAGKLVNSNITLHVVDLLSFNELQEKYEITATPTVVINELAKLEGELSLKELLEWVESVSEEDYAKILPNMLEKGMLNRVIEIALKKDITKALAELVFSSNMRVRIGAIAVLEELKKKGRDMKEAEKVLLEKVKEAESNIKGDAIYAISKISCTDVLPELKALYAEDGEVDKAIKEAIKEIEERCGNGN